VRGHPIGALEKPDSLVGQLRNEGVIQHNVLLVNQLVRQCGDTSQEFRRGQAVRTPLFHAMGDLLLESRDADFEELVEIGTHDAEKLEALQQRDLLVLCQIENAAVELQQA